MNYIQYMLKPALQILKLDDAANTAAYDEAVLYFEDLGFRGKTASDLALEKVHSNVLFDAGNLPEVDVVAKAWGGGDDASRRENYQKARKAKREAEEKLLQHEMNQSIREATDKWGKGIGLGMTAAAAVPFVVQAAPVAGSALKWGLTTPAGQAVTKKFIGDILLGTAGYMGFDALSTTVTGKTFGQNVADITGNVPVLKEIPYNWREAAGSFFLPGGYMAVGRGQLAANLLNRAERAAGRGIQYVDDLYRGYKTITNPKEMYTPMAEVLTPVKTSSAGIWTNRGTRSAKISEAERLGIPKGVRNNKNIVREVPDSQLDDKIWILKDGTYLEGTFRDIKPGQLFKYDPQDAISYTYTNGPDKNPLNPDRYLLSDGEFLGFDYMSEYGGNTFLTKDSHIYNHIKMLSNSLLHDKLKAIAADIQIPREEYALFLNTRYIQSFKQYYLNKGWRVGNLSDEEIAKIIAYNHKLLTSNLTGIAKDVILWNGSGKQTTADGTVVREAAPDNFRIITENLQGGATDIRGVWFSDFDDALTYGYPKQIGGSRQHTWEGVLLVDILPYLINDARGHVNAGLKYDARVAPKNLILRSRELVSGDLDNIKGLFPHPELILLEGNGFTRSWSTKGLHYKKGGKLNYLNLFK